MFKDPEKRREYHRLFEARRRAANPELHRAIINKSHDKHRARVNERNRLYMARMRVANPEKFRARAQLTKKRGKPPRQVLTSLERRERKRQCDRRYCAAHRGEACRRAHAWKANNRARARTNERIGSRRSIDKLSDSYLRKLLATDIGVPVKSIPPSLVEAKRAILKVLRLLPDGRYKPNRRKLNEVFR